jgi:hypothetical protein
LLTVTTVVREPSDDAGGDRHRIEVDETKAAGTVTAPSKMHRSSLLKTKSEPETVMLVDPKEGPDSGTMPLMEGSGAYVKAAVEEANS